MPATQKQLNKVGFNPRQAKVLTQLYDDAVEPSVKQFTQAGFSRTQALVLVSGTPSPDGGVTPAVKPSFRDLVVKGKFTRNQALLILQA